MHKGLLQGRDVSIDKQILSNDFFNDEQNNADDDDNVLTFQGVEGDFISFPH